MDNKLVLFRVVPTLYLTSEEVFTLTADDEAMLRELGAKPAMLDEMRAAASVPGRRVRMDFHSQAVIIESDTMTPPATPQTRATVN